MNTWCARQWHRFLCWMELHTDGEPHPLHWLPMKCKRCGREYYL